MSGLTKEQLEARGLVLAGMVDQEATIASLRAENERLREALKESVGLQSHYAELLNMHDGGQRLTFANAEAWLDRLK